MPLSHIHHVRQRGRLSETSLAARAAYALRSNDMGTITRAAPALYPHMWSWDAAFIAVGLARLSVPRAIKEMDTLMAAQWRNGMIPHIVFSAGVEDYFPGASRWSSDSALAAPPEVKTSGICQPPVHAIAVQRIVDAARQGGRADRQAGTEFVDRAWPRLLSWHRWLAESRDPEGNGRITIHHSWESGMDNSPRWDAPYARIYVGPDLPPYVRRDTQVVEDISQRPTDEDYDRYLWLVEEMLRVSYDDRLVRENASFAVEDVFFSAILAAACEVLARIGDDFHKPGAEIEELRSLAIRFRQGVTSSLDPATGFARDRDVRTGEWLTSETIAGFSSLLCGGPPAAQQRKLLRLLASEDWSGHPSFVAAVPPTTSPNSPDFRPREYWRGPQWPVITWLFSWAFAQHGWTEHAATLRTEGLFQLSGGDFAEYYEPFTGEPLGSKAQSWTAAVALDWLC